VSAPPGEEAVGAEPRADAEPLIEVRDLHVEFTSRWGVTRAVRGLSYTIARGESLGLVGESGSGKSVSALALLGLMPRHGARISHGSVTFEGQELVGLSEAEMRRIRAVRVAVVFQDPLSSLNPVMTIGRQITEVLEAHDILHGKAAWERARELLQLVGIPEPGRRLRQYPFELSGGMRQRAMIAMALSCSPSLLIADEPTTSLDVTIQAQILELLEGLRKTLNMSLLLITHNLGVVARFSDRIAVMYAGRIVESGPTARLLEHPNHPYTSGLLRSIPRLDQPPRSQLVPIAGSPPDLRRAVAGCAFRARCELALERCAVEDPPLREAGGQTWVACWAFEGAGARSTAPEPAPAPHEHVGTAGRHKVGTLVEVSDLAVWFPVRSGPLRRTNAWVRAVDGVSFDIGYGETLAIVGESGSGKTTVARAIARANQPSRGSVRLDGEEILALSGSRLLPYRRRVQMVFQDPYSSLDPRQTIGQILSEPLRVFGVPRNARRERVAQLLTTVGLDGSAVARYPHEFSGGQRQRVGIARALAVKPDLIICDEPISALDVSIQAQIVNVLMRLQRELGIAYIFIAHDLSIVRHLAHRVAVMYLGRIVELAPAEELYSFPSHPYTTALLSAIPVPNVQVEHERRRTVLKGDIPSPVRPPSGCPFHTRCPLRRQLGDPAVCVEEAPTLSVRPPLSGDHVVACHFPEEARQLAQEFAFSA
jgi:peptide/nickel transport system ATP-binding protein